MIEHKDRTKNEAIEYYGKEVWNKMIATGYLNGITCELRNGQLVIYGGDLERAYRRAVR